MTNTAYRKPLPGTTLEYFDARAAVNDLQPGAWEKLPYTARVHAENIVRRAKKLAIKRLIATGVGGIRSADLIESIHQEFKEHEDLPNTTNPDDWAKISGKKGERIIYIRTLVKGLDSDPRGGRAIERVGTGQYL